MSAVAARTPPRRRGGRRLLIVLVVILLIAGGAIFWLNSAAQASVNVTATLTVFQPVVTLAHGTGTGVTAITGATVVPGDSVMTDIKGRAAIQLPDGTLTRLASGTQITLDSAHFSKSGNLHDVKLVQKIGRTLTNVQHLVTGATFQVAGQSAVASVRGTKFEVLVNPNGSMLVKLFTGTLDLIGKTPKDGRHLVAPQQATADANGNVGIPGPIQPDPNDPFGPSLQASDAVAVGTTPGTEQDYVGAPLHNGEQQTYTYSYAGGGLIKAALGYPGSSMKLTVQAPDGQNYTQTGAPPIVVVVNNAPAGIYTIIVSGVSGLGPNGEEPYLSVAAIEPCVSTDIDVNGAVRRGYTQTDLAAAVQVNGLSNLKLTIGTDSPAGAIVTGTGTYNGVGWTGTVVLLAHGGALDIQAVSATVFGLQVPAQQIVQQIGSAINSDPSNVSPGFMVDRLYTCSGVVMIDGRHAK